MSSDLRDRIAEFKRIPGHELQDNDGNWRLHPAFQRDALRGILTSVGIADALLAYESERQGGLTLVDGHLRKGDYPDVEWPTLILDIDDGEADLLMATLDPLAAMAQMGAKALDQLIEKVKPNTGEPSILAMLDDLAEQAQEALAEVERETSSSSKEKEFEEIVELQRCPQCGFEWDPDAEEYDL